MPTLEMRYYPHLARTALTLVEIIAMYQLSLTALKDIRRRQNDLRELDLGTAKRIKDSAERQFALLVLERLPTLAIYHEPYIVELDHCLRQHNNKHATVPDFLVVRRGQKPLISGLFIEVTHLPFSQILRNKPKSSQRAVMKDARLNTRYIQISLAEIVEANRHKSPSSVEAHLFQGKLN